MATSSFAKPRIPTIKMNRTLKSLSELGEVQRQLTKEFKKYISELSVAFMRNYIKEHVYQNNELTKHGSESEYYIRTYELYDSISMNKDARGEWRVGVDSDLINPYPRIGNLFGQHTDYEDNDVSEYMWKYIDQGSSNYDGIQYIQATRDYIASVIDSEWENFKRHNGLL